MRDGFYLRFSTGLGYFSMAGTAPKANASISGLGSLSLIAIGGSVLPGFVVAGTLQAATTTASFNGGPFEQASVTSGATTTSASSKAAAAFSQLGLLFDWYPAPTMGWHVGLSGGFGISTVANQADDSSMFGTSVSGSVFGGYDFALGASWSTGISLFGSGATNATMKDKDGHDANYRFGSFSVGVIGSLLYF